MTPHIPVRARSAAKLAVASRLLDVVRHGACWAAKPSIASRLLDVACRGRLLYNGGVCHRVRVSCGQSGYNGTGRCADGAWHGLTPRGMGHAPTRACLGGIVAAAVGVTGRVDNDATRLWQCPGPGVASFQGPVEHNPSPRGRDAPWHPPPASPRGMGHAPTRACLGWHRRGCRGGDGARGQRRDASPATSIGSSSVVSGGRRA